jgi:hypothetical protein
MNVLARNDNGRDGPRVLEARFHPAGRSGPFEIVGKIVCHGPWAVLEVAPDFENRVPAPCSSATIITNLQYLTIMSRPRPFENLRTLENGYWSFTLAEAER